MCFSASLETVWLYCSGREKGRSPKRILLDGQDVTGACMIGQDARLDMAGAGATASGSARTLFGRAVKVMAWS